MDHILTEVGNSLGIITLNQDAKRNALSEPLLHAVSEALQKFHALDVRAVILRAHPACKVWSAGHSVDELPLDGSDPLAWQDPLRMIIRDIEQHPVPIIALVEGSVWGGACELVFACDMIVATPHATFAATPAKLGVAYNASGLLTFLNCLPLHIAKELLFTARAMRAERLVSYGVINHLVDADHITDFTESLAQSIICNSPLSIGVMKEQLRILSDARPVSPQGFERIQGLRRVVFKSADYREGISAFKERREPVYYGK